MLRFCAHNGNLTVAKMNFTHSKLKSALLASTVLLVPAEAFAQEIDLAQDVEEITVLGQYVPDEKRATSEIANVLDAEAFSQAGDGDIAIALQRLPGLSLVGGKYVYVRGLGDRYSASLLNGSSIPSLEPLRKVVPLDIFPTSIVESVLVQKTYSPEYPLEFAGGVVDIRTKTIPDEFILEVGISGKYNSESTGKDVLSYDGPGIEILGFGGSQRNIPDELLQDITLASLSEEELAAAGRAIPNIWSIDSENGLPGAGLNFALGNRYEVGSESAFGFFTAVNYDVETVHREGVRRNFTVNNQGLETRFSYGSEVCDQTEFQDADTECGLRQTNINVSLNGILSLGYEINANHSLNYTGTVLRQSRKRSLIETGQFTAEPDELRTSSTIDWIESQVWTNQITGDHNFILFDDSDVFLDTQLTWRVNYSRSDRDVPLRRSTIYRFEDDSDRFQLVANTTGNTTEYNALDEETKEFGFDLVQPMNIGNVAVDVKAGFTYLEKDRSFGLVRYNFQIPSSAGSDLRFLVPEIIFGPANIRPGGVRLVEQFDASDAYTASLKNYQGYLGFDAQVTDRVRIALGARYEDSLQTVNTVDRVLLSPVNVNQDLERLLPSATITYEFVDNMQLRLGYSETITRPDLRELSSAPFLDDNRGILVVGNPNLSTTEIKNYDARFEWYFGAGDSLTIGAFYKDFTNPIEVSVFLTGESVTYTYINGASADNAGIEVELEKFLFLQEWFGWDWLGLNKEFFLKANASYVDGETTTAAANQGNVTNLVRPFQGLSNWLANVQVGWNNHDKGESLALVFNYTSERLSLVGTFGAPDEFEQPPVTLDFVYSREFEVGSNILEFSFEASNLLDDGIQFSQSLGDDRRITEAYDLGRSVSLGFKYKF